MAEHSHDSSATHRVTSSTLSAKRLGPDPLVADAVERSSGIGSSTVVWAANRQTERGSLELESLELVAAGDSPEQALFGRVLAERHSGIVIVARNGVTRTGGAAHIPCELVIAADRGGTVRAALGSSHTCMTTQSVQDAHGWLVDGCLRALRLPTLPEPTPVVDFTLAVWLDRLMATLVHSASTPTWRRCVADLHGLVTDVDPGCRNPEYLGRALRQATPSWPQLHRAAKLGAMHDVPAEWARWMDLAMFSRWCLGLLPDVQELRADLELLFPESIASRVHLVVEHARAGLPPIAAS